MVRFIIYIVLFATLSSFIFADDPCKFTSDTKGTIDISSVGNTDGTPKYKDISARQNAFVYSYNPCQPFTEGDTCKDAAICQVQDDHAVQFMLGQQTSATWKSDDTSTTIQYRFTDAQPTTRTAVVTLNCPDDQSADTLVFRGEKAGPMGPEYDFQWTHKCLCWNGCKGVPPSGSGNGLGGGAIFIIILVSVFFAYFVVFLIINAAVRKQRGLEMIPHRTFWVAVPVYAKDGVLYIYRRATGKGGNYDSV